MVLAGRGAYLAERTVLSLVQGAKTERTDMAGSVVALGDRVVLDLLSAYPADVIVLGNCFIRRECRRLNGIVKYGVVWCDLRLLDYGSGGLVAVVDTSTCLASLCVGLITSSLRLVCS